MTFSLQSSSAAFARNRSGSFRQCPSVPENVDGQQTPQKKQHEEQALLVLMWFWLPSSRLLGRTNALRVANSN